MYEGAVLFVVATKRAQDLQGCVWIRKAIFDISGDDKDKHTSKAGLQFGIWKQSSRGTMGIPTSSLCARARDRRAHSPLLRELMLKSLDLALHSLLHLLAFV